jgi:hypothetical protein
MDILSTSYLSCQMQQTASRPYRSKRHRPCDQCRSRKACCRIEGELPCTNCLQINTACTFLQPPSKRRKPNTPTSEHLLVERLHNGFNFAADMGDVFTDGYLNEVQNFYEVSPSQEGAQVSLSPGDMSQDIGYIQQRAGEEPTNPRVIWNTTREDELEVEADVSLHIFEWEPGREDIQGLTHVVPSSSPLKSSMDAGVHSLDDLEGHSAQYFGLSGESDPYLLRHFRWDENGERQFIRVHFRNVLANNDTKEIPIHFALSKDELAKETKLETTISRDSSKGTARERLDKLIRPEDGRRLIALYVNQLLCGVYEVK